MITRNKARELRRLIEKAAISLPDEDAIDAVELYPGWKPDTAYEVDVRISYAGKLYRVVQAHTSHADWTPDITPALYTEVAKPGEIPVWKQPTGAQDAYMTGDKVYFPDREGNIWESTVNDNVWAPGVYGWERIS